jgi:hypothetical protein
MDTENATLNETPNTAPATAIPEPPPYRTELQRIEDLQLQVSLLQEKVDHLWERRIQLCDHVGELPAEPAEPAAEEEQEQC